MECESYERADSYQRVTTMSMDRSANRNTRFTTAIFGRRQTSSAFSSSTYDIHGLFFKCKDLFLGLGRVKSESQWKNSEALGV